MHYVLVCTEFLIHSMRQGNLYKIIFRVFIYIRIYAKWNLVFLITVKLQVFQIYYQACALKISAES